MIDGQLLMINDRFSLPRLRNWGRVWLDTKVGCVQNVLKHFSQSLFQV